MIRFHSFDQNDELSIDRLDYHRPLILESACTSPKSVEPQGSAKLSFDNDCTVHVRNVPIPMLPNLRNLFAFFGRVRYVRTLSPQSAFVVFFSMEAACNALCGPLPSDFGPIRVASYRPRPPSSSCKPFSSTMRSAAAPPGRGGMDRVAAPADNQSPPAVTRAELAQDWTRAADGTYKYGTASLDRVLVSQGLQCLDNPGNGNCAWYSLLDAGLGAMYSSYRQVKNTVHIFLCNIRLKLLSTLQASCKFLRLSAFHGLRELILTWSLLIETLTLINFMLLPWLLGEPFISLIFKRTRLKLLTLFVLGFPIMR